MYVTVMNITIGADLTFFSLEKCYVTTVLCEANKITILLVLKSRYFLYFNTYDVRTEVGHIDIDKM
jgi:hypothetical protein